MDVKIDGLIIPSTQIEGENLEEILVHLQENHIPEDKLVGDVLLNGESYSEDVPHASVEVLRQDVKDLEVITRTPEEIARHFIENSKQLVDFLSESLPKITEMFRLGDETEASEHFLKFLESLHLLMSMLEQSKQALTLDFSNIVSGHGSMDELLLEIAKTMTQLLDIQEQSDWVYLADILEYELSPNLETLSGVMPELKSKIH